MAIKHDAIKGRGTIHNVDPRELVIKRGWNSRKKFGDMESLCLQVIHFPGVRKPLLVKKNADGDIEVIDGERRHRAALMAIERGHDIKTVPCMFESKNLSELEGIFLQLLANDGLNFDPVEEADAFNRLLHYGSTIEDIAHKLGKSTVHVRERLVLINAVPDVQKAISDKEIPIGEGTKIVKEAAGSVDKQKAALTEVKKKRAAKKTNPKPRTPNLERVLDVLRIEMKKGTPGPDQAQFAEEIHEILNSI